MVHAARLLRDWFLRAFSHQRGESFFEDIGLDPPPYHSDPLFEALEPRVLLSVAAGFDSGTLTITLANVAENVTVDVQKVSDVDVVRVTANDGIVAIGGLKASAVRKIHVSQDGIHDDTITLRDVTTASFTSLATIVVNVGSGTGSDVVTFSGDPDIVDTVLTTSPGLVWRISPDGQSIEEIVDATGGRVAEIVGADTFKRCTVPVNYSVTGISEGLDDVANWAAKVESIGQFDDVVPFTNRTFAQLTSPSDAVNKFASSAECVGRSCATMHVTPVI